MILKFEQSFLQKLNSYYNYNGYTQILEGNRFHLCTIIIESTPFIVCIPLHSNCRSNFIQIKPPNSDKRWKKHGLEYGKMILVKGSDLEKYAFESGVNNDVWEDILSKEKYIVSNVKQYILNIVNYMQKKEQNLYLSRSESNDLNYSTLNCFPQYLQELMSYDISKLTFKFKIFSNIDDLISYVNNKEQ